nr:unnamed protein product [Digitaria exilis]
MAETFRGHPAFSLFCLAAIARPCWTRPLLACHVDSMSCWRASVGRVGPTRRNREAHTERW